MLCLSCLWDIQENILDRYLLVGLEMRKWKTSVAKCLNEIISLPILDFRSPISYFSAHSSDK